MIYATYLGSDGTETGWDCAVDIAGNVFLTGTTSSPTFPTTPDAFDTTHNFGGYQESDSFVVKLSSDGSALIYGTFLGGSTGIDTARGIVVNVAGNAFVVGETLDARLGFWRASRRERDVIDVFHQAAVYLRSRGGKTTMLQTVYGTMCCRTSRLHFA